MKKNYFKTVFLLSALFGIEAYSQVGINTDLPKATLDVAGKPTSITDYDGIIAPRITRSQLTSKNLYTTDQNGSLIYVAIIDGSTNGQTIDVTTTGYYYFDSALAVNKWIKVGNGSGPAINVTGTLPITANTTGANTTIGINRNSLNKGTGTNTATDAFTVTGGNANSVVGGADVSLTVNNTAPLWNANQIQGQNISTTAPTNNQVLSYNSTTNQWTPQDNPNVYTTPISKITTSTDYTVTAADIANGVALIDVTNLSNNSGKNIYLGNVGYYNGKRMVVWNNRDSYAGGFIMVWTTAGEQALGNKVIYVPNTAVEYIFFDGKWYALGDNGN